MTSLILVGCDSDADTEDKLIGKWKCQTVSFKFALPNNEGKQGDYIKDENERPTQLVEFFKKNGNLVYVDEHNTLLEPNLSNKYKFLAAPDEVNEIGHKDKFIFVSDTEITWFIDVFVQNVINKDFVFSSQEERTCTKIEN